MGKTTDIPWTDSTWNCWIGCKKVSSGCKNCYMFRERQQYGQIPTDIHRTSLATFYAPKKWSARKIFVCSWSDFFLEEADEWRNDAWDVIRSTPQHTYQILTKRPQRIEKCLPDDWGEGWKHVWLGVSVEDQKTANERIPLLLKTPASIRFASYEPALEPIEFGTWLGNLYNTELGTQPYINWVIMGGESGPNARPMNPDWARSVRDQCQLAGVPFFHKQNGGKVKIDGTYGNNLIEGKVYHEFPNGVE